MIRTNGKVCKIVLFDRQIGGRTGRRASGDIWQPTKAIQLYSARFKVQRVFYLP